MTLSGCRPAVVTSWSSRNRLPALGPRLTTSRADPAGRDSTAPACASAADSTISGWSPVSSPPTLGITLVDSPTRSWDRADPHWAQKRLPSGFSWPHRVQCTLGLLRCEGPPRPSKGPRAAGGRRTGQPVEGRLPRAERRAVGHGTSRSARGSTGRTGRGTVGCPAAHRGTRHLAVIIVIPHPEQPVGGPVR